MFGNPWPFNPTNYEYTTAASADDYAVPPCCVTAEGCANGEWCPPECCYTDSCGTPGEC